MIPHRRHRKETTTPLPLTQTRSNDSTDDNNDMNHKDNSSGGSGGLYSYFATARRRWGNHKEVDTLLPTTYNASGGASGSGSGSPNRRNLVTPTAKTCNDFLMGGHYYPGKDKKRRHMRKRTLWYRIFCASTWRRVASFLMALYAVLFHVLVPLGGWILEVGIHLSAGSKHSLKANWLQYDTNLIGVPSIQEEESQRLDLATERARLQYGNENRHYLRLQVLEEIVPIWFHRNDNHNKKVAAGKPKQQYNKTAPEKKKKRKNQKDQIANNTTDIQNNKNKPEAAGLEHLEVKQKQRMLRVTGENLQKRTLKNMDMLASNHSSCGQFKEEQDFATTLVMQTSIERLWILNETCSRWRDPIVAVVFVPHKDGEEEDIPSDLSLPPCVDNLKLIRYDGNPEESMPSNYPVNRLRNVGLDAVTTSHILVMDVDFVPSNNLSDLIRKGLHTQQQYQEEFPQALVVPAFEKLPPKPCKTKAACSAYLKSNSSFIPSSFPELQHCYQTKSCIVFQSKNNWEGHSSTRSENWLQRMWYEDNSNEDNNNAPKKFNALSCFHTSRYEPYVVLRWCPSASSSKTTANKPVAPYYDERFHGYGKNKIELISHLRKSGYRFAVLPEGFIVHNPHPESSVKETWNDRDENSLHGDMDKLYGGFLKELDAKYEAVHETSIKLCPHK